MKKSPESCTGMEEIRAQVNWIDRKIIALLGERLGFVHAAVRFKADEESVRRPDHWDTFFLTRKLWAEEEGYPASVIESIYRTLYDYTIEVQLTLLAKKSDDGTKA